MDTTVALFSALIFILSLIYFKIKWNYSYWKRKNVPQSKPTAILGDYGDYMLMKKSLGEVAQDLCRKFPKEPYIGTYFGTRPALIVQDPDLIKLITTKDYYFFNCRELIDHVYKEHGGHTMFFAYGDKWKVTRQNMTPLFSLAKMKNMYHLIEQCTHRLESMLDEEAQSGTVDARASMAKFTMDCISSCGYGIDVGTMKKTTEKNPFTSIGGVVSEVSNARGLSLIVRSAWPGLFYGLGMRTMPKLVSEFFHNLTVNVFKARNYEPTSRNDFTDLLLELKKNKQITGDSLNNPKFASKKITMDVDDNFLVAQSMLFFGAGFETSSTTMSNTLYELAKHPEVQRRVFQEVDEYMRKHSNKLEYELVNELPYLLACIDETLRLYPVLGVLTREVVEDYTLPTGVRLERGTRIHLPLYALQHNPDNFPEPEKYIPERFLTENKHNVKPYTYMPFGEGPRLCIGKRFSRMQTLSGLLAVMKKYKVELADGMPKTLELDPRAFAITPKSGIHLKLVERDGWQQRLFARDTATD